MSKLAGKVAIVTGAGRGIGRGIARRFAAEGAAVMVAERRRESGETVAGEIRDAGGTAIAFACDVSDDDDVRAMVERTVAEFGTVHILVNNAQGWGIGADQVGSAECGIEDFPVEWWRETLATGLFGTWHCSKAVFPHMRAQRYGKVINFGSNFGLYGHPRTVDYNCTKEAIRAFTKTAANEWAEHGIRVNVICPAIMTDSIAALRERDPQRFAEVTAKLPLGYWGDPERDGGGMATFLASEDGDYVTGTTLMLEGGYHIMP